MRGVFRLAACGVVKPPPVLGVLLGAGDALMGLLYVCKTTGLQS
jgi:hypothetical protein